MFHGTQHKRRRRCIYKFVNIWYKKTMTFEWDENKNRINKAKHGVDFETASHVFDDPLLASRIEGIVDGEERWQSIGTVKGVLLLLVVHLYTTDHTTTIRMISARKADKNERKHYERGSY
jgi:uncharacterized protein